MTYQQCNACLGEYDDTSADGAPYFHVCPPLERVKILRDDGTETIGLRSEFTDLVLVESQAAKDQAVEAGANAATIAIVLRRRFLERPDHRDENTLRWQEDPQGRRRRILKAEGAGARRATRPQVDAVGDPV